MAPLEAFVAMAVSLLLGGVCWKVGRFVGLLDRPDDQGLKVHSTSAVPLGGVGILVGLHAGLVIAGLSETGLVLGSLLIWTLGFLDDLQGLGPWTRLLGATMAGVLLVIYQDAPSGLAAGTAAVVVVVLSINATNLLDGLDALAASVAVTALVGLAVLARTNLGIGSSGIVIAAAAVLGFLFWNLPPARLFLGNNGAYLVGLVLGWAAVQQGTDWLTGAVAVAAIGVPFIDLGITIVRRLRSGAALFGGDRDHTYDRLHQKGWSPLRVAILFSGAQAVWSTLIVVTALAFGDTTALVIAVTLAAVLVLRLGLSETPTATAS